MKIVRIYQASWGAWYAGVELGGQYVELKFADKPDDAMILATAQAFFDSLKEPDPTIELEAEDGQAV